MLTFIYALSVTPFEYNMLGEEVNNLDYLKQQDYPIHALFCAETKKVVCYGDPIKGITERIDNFLDDLRKCGIEYKIAYRILCSREQNEKYLTNLIFSPSKRVN